MSSSYRPNAVSAHYAPAKDLKLNELGQDPISSCDGCISIATTQAYRSPFDKAFIPIYQTQLEGVNTDLETTLFAK